MIINLRKIDSAEPEGFMSFTRDESSTPSYAARQLEAAATAVLLEHAQETGSAHPSYEELTSRVTTGRLVAEVLAQDRNLGSVLRYRRLEALSETLPFSSYV